MINMNGGQGHPHQIHHQMHGANGDVVDNDDSQLHHRLQSIYDYYKLPGAVVMDAHPDGGSDDGASVDKAGTNLTTSTAITLITSDGKTISAANEQALQDIIWR